MSKRALEKDIVLTTADEYLPIGSWISEQMPELCAPVYEQGLLLGSDPELDKGLWHLAQTNTIWHNAFTANPMVEILKKKFNALCDMAQKQALVPFRTGRAYSPLFLHCAGLFRWCGLSPDVSRAWILSVLKDDQFFYIMSEEDVSKQGHSRLLLSTAYAQYCQNLNDIDRGRPVRENFPTPPVPYGTKETMFRGNLPDTPMGRAYCHVLQTMGPTALVFIKGCGLIDWDMWITKSDEWVAHYDAWTRKLPEEPILACALAFASHSIKNHYGSYEFQLIVQYLITNNIADSPHLDAFADCREVKVLRLMWIQDKRSVFVDNGYLRYHNPFYSLCV